MTVRAGLDLGGAHLKVALVENEHLRDVRQFVCPLWQGLNHLDHALRQASPLLSQATEFALTMTGELSDLFPDRTTGVKTLLKHIEDTLDANILVWMGSLGFGTLTEAREQTVHVGSTNFLATASYLSRHISEALLVDFGSTTVDILLIRGGKPVPHGLTDAVRQRTGELVYTGYTRTAVMGVTTKAPFKGEMVGLAREYLATMADVRRILSQDLKEVDLHQTADGKDKSLLSSLQRFARMFGRDQHEGSLEEWRISAHFVHKEQIKSILDGICQVLSRTPLPGSAPLIAAGCGEDEIINISAQLGRPCLSFSTYFSCPSGLKKAASTCAPAVSVAFLSGDSFSF